MKYFKPKNGPETHHVVPNGNGGWDIKRGGGQKSIKHTKTKQEAIDIAREISRNQGTELRIHNLDGKIANSDSHGKVPFPPEDKK